jgi:predicted nucleic acid-binding protein
MILVDANILMYAAGADHPNKGPSVRFLEAVAKGRVSAAIDAEVLQEALHRYRAIGSWDDGRRVCDGARRIFDIVYPITAEILDHARVLLDSHAGVSARDALHAAVVISGGLDALCSYDQGFDVIPEVQRIEPGDLSIVGDDG